MNSLVSLMQHKSWVEAGFYEAIHSVDPIEKPDFHKELGYYLSHTHIVDQIFKAHLMGERHGFSSTVTDFPPNFSWLSKSCSEINRWLIDYAGALDEQGQSEQIHFKFTDGDAGCLTRAEMLVHVATHSLYHLSVLTQSFVREKLKPPRILYTSMRSARS